MSNTPRNLTRNQLAEFLPNQRAVRAFEQLLKQVSDLLPSDLVTINRLIEEAGIEAADGSAKAQAALDLLGGIVQDAFITSGAAESKASQALDSLSRIAQALELISGAPVARESSSLALDYVDFNLNPQYGSKVGRVHWGSTGTLEIEMGNGNITQQVGEEFFTYGKATAAITEGQLIMVTGAVGASGVVTFAPTSIGLLDPNAILGVATENIALNGFGRVTMLGVVHGIDTSGTSVGEVWLDGDVLWYNPSFVGGMTRVKPVAPNMKTQVAIVIHAGAGGSGSLQVEILNGSMLGGTDSNVQLGALADKQLLQYDAVAGYWKNVAASAVASGTATNLAGGLAGAVPYQTAANTTAMLAIGAAAQVLQVNAGATAPEWVGSTGTGNVVRASAPTLSAAILSGTTNVSGGQLQFPGAQSASAGANVLDDYEEGTWSPTLTTAAGSVTGANQGSLYVKIGQLVIAYGYINVSAVSTPSGALTINGLPFTSRAQYGAVALSFFAGGLTTAVNGYCGGSSTVINVTNFNSNTILAGANIMFTAMYRASA